MKVKKVISSKNLPRRAPFLDTIVYVTAMDYWNAPQWLWGAVGLLLLIGWISFIYVKKHEEDVEVMKEWAHQSDNGTTDKKKSKFQERCENAMKKHQPEIN